MGAPGLPPDAVTGTLNELLSDVEVEAEAIGRVEKQLTERRRGLEKRCGWLRRYLADQLLKRGG